MKFWKRARKESGIPQAEMPRKSFRYFPMRLMADTSALTDAAMMSSCVPAPQDTSPSGVLIPTYAMALEFDPCSMACSWYLMMEYRYPRLA